ncbi:ROK family protein [Allocoprobacillus halotolerans]|uniref:ROK family protein n=1 Tax=Allocoprobacillus halotolerans TaxID=2944914 RepID=A0ABY5I6Q6_9FIRM|nr:ROK family protein [Allocoprobacillus halotolerans]UTY40690.1 ROK family protein [Allocoprobacillus halotolerans]
MKYLVLDVGGSSIKYALMNEQAHIEERGSIPTPQDTLEHFIETIGQLYDRYQDCIEGIAISMPGILDPQSGYCFTGGVLSYIREIPMKEKLQQRCPCPITIGNDAKCAGAAELGFGNLKGIEEGVVIVLGTAIGGCVISQGEVQYGKHFFGGEFSMIFSQGIEGEDFWWATNGILGLLKCVQKCLGTDQEYNGVQIFEMANQGHSKVQEAIKDFVRILVKRIYSLQCVLDPEKFVIGGGISAQPILFEYIEEINNEIFENNDYYVKPVIEPCYYRNDANLVGALYQFLNQE